MPDWVIGLDKEEIATERASEVSSKLLRIIELYFLMPEIKHGIFIEENGGISIVMQSIRTDRRINYMISPTSGNLFIILINENNDPSTHLATISDENHLEKLAAWVVD